MRISDWSSDVCSSDRGKPRDAAADHDLIEGQILFRHGMPRIWFNVALGPRGRPSGPVAPFQRVPFGLGDGALALLERGEPVGDRLERAGVASAIQHFPARPTGGCERRVDTANAGEAPISHSLPTGVSRMAVDTTDSTSF